MKLTRTLAALAALVLAATTATTFVPDGHAASAHPPEAFFDITFEVEISGIAIDGTFSSIEGLDSETEVVEYSSGEDPAIRKRPGRTTYGDITLKRGYVDDGLWDWVRATMEGAYDPRSATIVIKDADGTTELTRFGLHSCFPSRGIAGPLTPGDPLLQTIVLTCDSIAFSPP